MGFFRFRQKFESFLLGLSKKIGMVGGGNKIFSLEITHVFFGTRPPLKKGVRIHFFEGIFNFYNFF